MLASTFDTQALLLLASAHLSVGRHARATRMMQDAVKVSDQPELRTALGISLVGSGQYADAIRELETAFAKDPGQLPAGYTLASIYVQSGQGANAVRVAEALIKTHSNNAGVLALLGAARRTNGDLPGARAAFEAALRVDPRFLSAQVSLARVEMVSNALPQAQERLAKALAQDEKNLDTLFALAELAERNRQWADAQRYLTKADEYAGPNNPVPALALVDFTCAATRHSRLRKRSAAPKARHPRPSPHCWPWPGSAWRRATLALHAARSRGRPRRPATTRRC